MVVRLGVGLCPVNAAMDIPLEEDGALCGEGLLCLLGEDDEVEFRPESASDLFRT